MAGLQYLPPTVSEFRFPGIHRKARFCTKSCPPDASINLGACLHPTLRVCNSAERGRHNPRAPSDLIITELAQDSTTTTSDPLSGLAVLGLGGTVGPVRREHRQQPDPGFRGRIVGPNVGVEQPVAAMSVGQWGL